MLLAIFRGEAVNLPALDESSSTDCPATYTALDSLVRTSHHFVDERVTLER